MHWKTVAIALLLAGCGQQAVVEAPANDSTPLVPAVAETRVADNPAVDADDPLLWADPQDPTRALWIGTDKTLGLYVHGLDGAMRQFLADGPMNNVDLRSGFTVDGQPHVLVSATERERFGVMHWLLDPATLSLSGYGFVPLAKEFGEPYGYCMGQWQGEYLAIPNNKRGEVAAFAITAGVNGPEHQQRAAWKLGSQTEGCVFDDRTGDLYVGEEDVAIWRMSMADPSAAPVRVADVDGRQLVADVEGLTIMRDGDASYLIASSQGDSAYAVYAMEADALRFINRFRIGGGTIDPVTATDGINAWSGPIGGFPEGAIVVHDDCETDGADTPAPALCEDDQQQNFKLVDWRDVKAAIGIN